MNKYWTVSLIFIFIFVVYFFVVPRNIYKKNNYYIEKIINIKNDSPKTGNHEGYFYSENECGYFSLNEGITHYKKSENEKFILANNLFYLIYDKSKNLIELFSPKGELISTLVANGYPYIYNNLPIFFIIKNDNRGISLFTNKGEKLFDNVTFTSIITSISLDKNINTLVSTMDGNTYLFSTKGELVFNNEFNYDSEIIITKSSTIDYSGENIAVCSGINPEYIEVFRKSDNFKIHKYKTETNFRYNILMQFVKNRLYYEGMQEIKFINIKNKKTGALKIIGEIIEMKFDDSGNILIATRNDDIYYLTIFSFKSRKVFYKEFNESISSFCFLKSDVLYFRCNDNIVKIRIG